MDVYSLGCVLYECLTARQPFPRERETEVLYGHVQDPPPKVTEHRPELDPALDGVIARAMAKDPALRFESCGDVIDAARAVTPQLLRLNITGGNAAGTTIDVADVFLIGRDAAGQGSFAGDAEISREHARISRRPNGRYAIEDLGSTNGTFVNRTRIEQPHPLAAGDLIEVGATVLVVSAAPEAEAPQIAGDPPVSVAGPAI